MMPTLSLLVAEDVVVVETSGTASDITVGAVTTTSGATKRQSFLRSQARV